MFLKYLLALSIILVGLTSEGQGTQGLTSQPPLLDSLQLEDVIQQVEQKTPFRFYYRADWLEGIKVMGPVPDTTLIVSWLEERLAGTVLSLYRSGQSLIITSNDIIRTELPIEIRRNNPGNATLEEGEDRLFSREYSEHDGISAEDRIYPVGNRKYFDPGATRTVAGYVREVETGNPVEGAFLYIQEPFLSTSTDEKGFFVLAVPSGRKRLFAQSVNMKNTYRDIVVYSDGQLDISMEVDVIALNAVTVNAEREVNVKSAQMGVTKISTENINTVPALFGEKDVVKVATTAAGVQFVGEGAAGINIRGGKADQNLFLIDGTPVYNTNHFFGFFSAFNAEAIQSLEVYKSAMPAHFGGRLSSVFDITSKKTQVEKVEASGGIGPVTSNIMVRGALGENGPGVLLSGRANYSSFVLDQINNSTFGNNKASFYDLLGKVSEDIGSRDQISVTGYLSFDRFQLRSDTLLSFSDFNYRNQAVGANWKHTFSDKLEMNTHVGLSKYSYSIAYDELVTQAFEIDYSLLERNLKIDFDLFSSEEVNYNFGFDVKGYRIDPGKKSPFGEESLIVPVEIPREQGVESAAYFSSQLVPNDRLSFQLGLRYSLFQAMGPGEVYGYDPDLPLDFRSRLDTTNFGANEVIQAYHGPEYRLTGRYSLNDESSLKLGLSRTRQYVHLLLNAASIAPNDNWRLSGAHIKPQIADQISFGYYRNIYTKHLIELSAEVYYKRIQNLLDFKVGTDLQFNRDIETDILQGDGQSYGIEFSVKKTGGWLTGWLNYTFSRSLIRLDGGFPSERINRGEFFPTGYDKPHYFNSVINYKFNRRFTVTLSAVYATGIPVTYPVGKWQFKGVENLFYSERNGFRIPDYFRTDLGLNLNESHKLKKFAHASWTFSVYNLLGRDNIYSVFFRVEEGQVEGFKLTVFRNPIPTITYNFHF